MAGIGDVLLPIFSGLAKGASDHMVEQARRDRAEKAHHDDLWMAFLMKNPELINDPEAMKRMDTIMGKGAGATFAQLVQAQQAYGEMTQRQLTNQEVPGTGGGGFMPQLPSQDIPNLQFPVINSQTGGSLLPEGLGNVIGAMAGGGSAASPPAQAPQGVPVAAPGPAPAPGSNQAIAQAARAKGLDARVGGAPPTTGGLPPLGTQVIGRTPEGRPIIRNPDGSVSSHRNMIAGFDNKFYIVPTMFGGKEYPPEQAAEIITKNNLVDPDTGITLVPYNSQAEAEQAEQVQHKAMEQQMGNLGGGAPGGVTQGGVLLPGKAVRAPGKAMKFSDVPAGLTLRGKAGSMNWSVTGQNARDLNLGTPFNQLAFILNKDPKTMTLPERAAFAQDALRWTALGKGMNATAEAAARQGVEFSPGQTERVAGRAGAVKSAEALAQQQVEGSDAGLSLTANKAESAAFGTASGANRALDTAPAGGGMTPRERQVAQVRAEAEARRGVTQGKAALDFASDKARLESLNAAVGSNLALHTPGPDGFTPYEWNLRKVREEAEARQRVELDPNAVQARVAERAATETAVGKAKTAQEGSPAALAVVGRQASQREKGAAAGAAAGMNLPLDTVGGKTPGELKAEQVARETKARTMNMAPSLDMAKVLTAEEQVISSLDTVVRHFDPKFIGGVRGSDWLQAIRTRIGPRLPGMIAGKEAKFDAALATARQQFGRALTGLAMTDQERTDFLEIFPTKFQGSPEAFIARLENVYNDVHVRITRYREILGHTREEAMAPGAAQSEKVTFVPGPGGKGLQKLPPMFEMDKQRVLQGLPFREFLQRNTQYGKVLQGELDRAIQAGEVPPGTVLEDVIDFK